MKNYIVIIIVVLFYACKQDKKAVEIIPVQEFAVQEIKYASGFTIENHKTFKEIKINSPWPDAKSAFTYILHPIGTPKPSGYDNASFITIPVKKVVVTSTTDIPMLEYLNLEHTLVGFPHTDYISSEKTRSLIDKGVIKELGSERSLNTEVILELAPDLMIGFSATGDTKAYDLIEKTGIPVVMNGSWMEQHPLGRAEWIKFIAAFFNKEEEAQSIFKKIEKDYNDATVLAKNAINSPTVLSGSMFEDIWYVPGGNSYVAKFLKDANTTYLWADKEETGSLTLNFESVLEKAQNAQLWIGSGGSSSLEELKKKSHQYSLFDPFKNKTVYSSTLKKGAKGGLIFFELGPMRPDLILKDIIQIAHPTLLQDYELYFFEKLN